MRWIAHYMARTARAARAEARGPSTEQELIELAAMARNRRAREAAAQAEAERRERTGRDATPSRSLGTPSGTPAFPAR